MEMDSKQSTEFMRERLKKEEEDNSKEQQKAQAAASLDPATMILEAEFNKPQDFFMLKLIDLKIEKQKEMMSNQKIIKNRTNYKDNTAAKAGSFDSFQDKTYYGDSQTRVIVPVQFDQYISQRSELHDPSRTIEVRNHRKDMSKQVELDSVDKSDVALT